MEDSTYLSSLLNYLPSLKAKSVLQIGGSDLEATKLFVEQLADTVTIVDANQAQLESNRNSNSSYQNLKFLNNSESLANSSFDLVYSNSQLEQLTNEKTIESLNSWLRVLNLNGLVLLIENFSNLTTDSEKTPTKFIDLVQSVVLDQESVQYGYDLIFAKPTRLEATNRVSFLFNKIKLENHHGFKTLKEFMDHKQYSRNGVLRYEKIFGSGFVSTGGIETTSKFLQELNLQPGQRVLDVGCGIGGGDFYMAEKYGVEVLGLDLSSNMIGIAWDRAPNHTNLNVQFEIGDVTKNKFPSNHFDLIYSRDTILHIADKESLFAKFKDWLKPGGKIFITDYCCGPKPWSDEYASYVEQRGYNLLTVEEYGNIFTNLGFSNVKATDVTNIFVDCLNMELKKFEEIRQEFVSEFNLEDFNYLVEGWQAKLVRCGEGHQRWGKFYSEKL